MSWFQPTPTAALLTPQQLADTIQGLEAAAASLEQVAASLETTTNWRLLALVVPSHLAGAVKRTGREQDTLLRSLRGYCAALTDLSRRHREATAGGQ